MLTTGLRNRWTQVYLSEEVFLEKEDDARQDWPVGLVTITLLDLLVLDDITTAGAWMPEIGFVITSVPALMVLTYFTFRGTTTNSPCPPVLEDGN